jgi:hypothetical protein
MLDSGLIEWTIPDKPLEKQGVKKMERAMGIEPTFDFGCFI